MIDMGDAHQSHARAVRQGDRRVVILHGGGCNDLVDCGGIFTDEGNRVAMRCIEADDRVVAGDAGVLDQGRPSSDLDRIVAGAATDGIGTAAAGDQIVAAARINRIGASAALDRIISAEARDQIGTAAPVIRSLPLPP